jgi:methyltransferase
MAAVPGPWLVAFVAYHLAQRAVELRISARNTRRRLARGAREFGRGHFPAMVAIHALFPVALVTEVLAVGVQPGRLAPFWLALFVAAQFLRAASMRALGGRWTARVLVVEGEPPIEHGVYRWTRHPSYAAVAVELLAAPLMFGAWRTALVFSLANLLVLRVRIRCEGRALAGRQPPGSA